VVDTQVGDAAEQGLRQYVREVADAIGIGPGGTWCEVDGDATAYVALDRRPVSCPRCDAALVWDEVHGWALAIETGAGENLVVFDYCDGGLMPTPETVAEFTEGALAARYPRSGTPNPTAHDRETLYAKLARYARRRAGVHHDYGG